MKLYPGKQVLWGPWEQHTRRCPGVTSLHTRCVLSTQQAERLIPGPAVYTNQSHQIIAHFHPSLHMCGLPSTPQLLPWGVTPKADSVIFM